MKTTRVMSLLFSLCQFLLFLKFIEMIRGDPIPKSQEAINGSSASREQRHFFVAPRKERKSKPWLSTTSTAFPINSTQDLYVDQNGTISYNATDNDRIDLAGDNLTNTTSSESASGRLCPGCEGGTCGATTTSSYRFPGIPLLIALAVGVIWFFAFLFLFFFMIDPPKVKPSYAPSSGYGYGGGGGYDGWTQHQQSSQGGGGLGGGLSSLLNIFSGDHQRSFDNIYSLTDYVLSALDKFSKLYSES